MGTVLKVKLSAESLAKAATEVERYRKSLDEKGRMFRQKLIERGIEVAQENSGEYAGYISFTFDTGSGDVSYLVGKGEKIHREWRYRGGTKGYDVDPLLLAEFGSGWLSEVLFAVDGVGQGTMPEQKHAFDQDGWRWVDRNPKDGIPMKNGWYAHRSKGESPTHPMYHAEMAMLEDVAKIAREVFQTNEVIRC